MTTPSSQWKAAAEAILFASGEPVPVQRLAQALDISAGDAVSAAEALKAEYAARHSGLVIVRLDDHYQMCSHTAYAADVRRALDIRRNTPLSQAALEVLAIVAYNQPVTRAFIEQVRGVDCGAVLQGLLQKELIEERGRLELPGRPLIYGTTPVFLRCFGISELRQLPPLPGGEHPAEEMVEPTLEDAIQLLAESGQQTEE